MIEIQGRKIDTDGFPAHIAIIMDGNRRWAKAKNMLPSLGHKEGANTLEKILHFSNKIGIKHLTVYAFSTENWKRTEEEVGAIMTLLSNYLTDFSKRADDENIRVKFLGNIGALPGNLHRRILDVIERTKNNTGLTFNIAFNYGGRAEITQAVKQIAEEVKAGNLKPEDISEAVIEDHLYTKGQPDPDLLIRTSGELRTSNFLPWQLVYSEFVVLPKMWPEFEEEDLLEAIETYKQRNRKFGGK